MPDREKVIEALKRCIYDPDPGQLTKEFLSCSECPYCHGCTHDLMRDALALLKEQETIPSYNDAVDTIKFQSKVMAFACQKLAEYESEEPCNTLFYIKEQRQKCDERCCNDKTPDEWCWRRYITLMVTEGSPTPEQMRDTKWEEK